MFTSIAKELSGIKIAESNVRYQALSSWWIWK